MSETPREVALRLCAETELHDAEIAARVGVSRGQITKWRNPEKYGGPCRPDGSRKKTCPKCGKTRMLKSFNRAPKGSGFVVINPDGARECRQSYCSPCSSKLKKAWRAGMSTEERTAMVKRDRERFKERHPDWRERFKSYQNLEVRRAAQKRRRAKLLQNPEALEEAREYARLLSWEQRRKAGARELGPRSINRIDRVAEEGHPRILRKPFIDWLEPVLAMYGVMAFCELTGIPERSLWRLRFDTGDHVELDLVDRALTREGGTSLRQLYPSLYGEPEEARNVG